MEIIRSDDYFLFQVCQYKKQIKDYNFTVTALNEMDISFFKHK